jgi:peptidoglycan hydrolase CwlO-like protein
VLSFSSLVFHSFCDDAGACHDAAESHLQSERRGVQDKIRLLQEEVSLIDQHLEQQRLKFEEVSWVGLG